MYGVVGWIDLEAADANRQIEAIRHPRLVGVRPMIQDIPDNAWISQPAVMRNLAAGARSGLRFDALAHTRHLPYLIEAIQPVPDLVVVIDHLADTITGSRDSARQRTLACAVARAGSSAGLSGGKAGVPVRRRLLAVGTRDVANGWALTQPPAG